MADVTQEQFRDLIERMRQAQHTLHAMAHVEVQGFRHDERIRLNGKAEGVGVAISYAEELLREVQRTHTEEVEFLGQFDPRLTQADMPDVVRRAFGVAQEMAAWACEDPRP